MHWQTPCRSVRSDCPPEFIPASPSCLESVPGSKCLPRSTFADVAGNLELFLSGTATSTEDPSDRVPCWIIVAPLGFSFPNTMTIQWFRLGSFSFMSNAFFLKPDVFPLLEKTADNIESSCFVHHRLPSSWNEDLSHQNCGQKCFDGISLFWLWVQFSVSYF